MAWWGYVLSAVGLGYAGWLGVTTVWLLGRCKTMKTQIEHVNAVIRDEVQARKQTCREHLEYMRAMDAKLDTVCSQTNEIAGYLKGRNGSP